MARGDLQIQDLRVIMLLSESRAALTTKQISDRLDIPMRTVQRIISAIEQIPLPMRRDSAGMGGGIKLLGDFALRVSLPSNLVEMAALLVARHKMRELTEGTLLGEAFEQFTGRVIADLKGEQRAFCERFAGIYQTKPADTPANASPISNLVHKAIDGRYVLVIEYVSPRESRPKRREIEPFGVWIGNARSYVVGRDRGKDAIRTFAIDRIRGASLSDKQFLPPRDFDVAKYFGSSLGAFVGDGPAELELVLDPEAARRLGGKLPNKQARLIKRPDGGASLHWSAPVSDELLAWMVTLGPGVKIAGPAEAAAFARDAFTARAAAQPKATARKTKARAAKKKPIALPGPLARRMKSTGRR